MHKRLNNISKMFLDQNPEQWPMKVPFFRYAWNFGGKEALGGLSPFQIITSLQPSTPLPSWLCPEGNGEI